MNIYIILILIIIVWGFYFPIFVSGTLYYRMYTRNLGVVRTASQRTRWILAGGRELGILWKIITHTTPEWKLQYNINIVINYYTLTTQTHLVTSSPGCSARVITLRGAFDEWEISRTAAECPSASCRRRLPRISVRRRKQPGSGKVHRGSHFVFRTSPYIYISSSRDVYYVLYRI